jgi:hypothetical protein
MRRGREEAARGGVVEEAVGTSLPCRTMATLAMGARRFVRVLVDEEDSRMVAVSMAAITGFTGGAMDMAIITGTGAAAWC